MSGVLSVKKNDFFLISILVLSHIFFIYISLYFNFIAPAFLVFLVFLILILNKPHYGISLLIISHYFILTSTEDITITELAVGGFIGAVILFWIIRELTSVNSFKQFEKKEFLVIFLFGVALFSFIPAAFYGSKLLKWFRELIPFVILRTELHVAMPEGTIT